MKLSEQEKQYRREVRERMAKMRGYLARNDRYAFFNELRRQALSKTHLEKIPFLKWCLRKCVEAKIRPSLGHIKGAFDQINSTPPAFVPLLIKCLPFEKHRKGDFNKLFNQAFEKAK